MPIYEKEAIEARALKKVLIVEDSQTFTALVSNLITSELGFSVDIAHTFKDACSLLDKAQTYFLVLVDVHLPDAKNGEAVDFFLQKQIPTVVITSDLNPELRDEFIGKEIIDYVLKDRKEVGEYIISKICRLIKNEKYRVLIVEDSKTYIQFLRQQIKNQFFRVATVTDGKSAFRMIERFKDIKLVITDYHMPIMSGLELTVKLRKKYSKHEISIIGLSSDQKSSIHFLRYGANDFIQKPFIKEELSCRVNNTIEALENIEKLNNSANIDYLTQVSNRKHFYALMKNYLPKALKRSEKFVIAMLDIDNFKIINDTYGHEAGDDVLKNTAYLLKRYLKSEDIIARFGGEEFCIVVKDISAREAHLLLKKILSKIEQSTVVLTQDQKINYTVSIGLTTNILENIDAMIHQADYLLYQVKNNGKNQVITDCKSDKLLLAH